MEKLAAALALNGVALILFASLIGLLLARALHRGDVSEHWHLLHASGTSRGIMLVALSAAIEFAELPYSHLLWATAFVLFFAWTSVMAMFLRGLSGERGFHPGGSLANKAVFYLYASGTIALPIGLVWLLVGFFRAWV